MTSSDKLSWNTALISDEKKTEENYCIHLQSYARNCCHELKKDVVSIR